MKKKKIVRKNVHLFFKESKHVSKGSRKKIGTHMWAGDRLIFISTVAFVILQKVQKTAREIAEDEPTSLTTLSGGKTRT